MAIVLAKPLSSYENVKLQLAQDAHELAGYPSTYGDKIRFAQDVSANLARYVKHDHSLLAELHRLAGTIKDLDRSGDTRRAEQEVLVLIGMVNDSLYTAAPTVTIRECHETPEQIAATVAAGIVRRTAEMQKDAAVKKFIADRAAPAVRFFSPGVNFVTSIVGGVTSKVASVASGVASKVAGVASGVAGLVNFRRSRNGTFAVSKREYSGQHRLVACPPDHPYLMLGELYGITLREGERCEVRKQDASTVTLIVMDGFDVQVSRRDFTENFDVVEIAPEVHAAGVRAREVKLS